MGLTLQSNGMRFWFRVWGCLYINTVQSDILPKTWQWGKFHSLLVIHLFEIIPMLPLEAKISAAAILSWMSQSWGVWWNRFSVVSKNEKPQKKITLLSQSRQKKKKKKDFWWCTSWERSGLTCPGHCPGSYQRGMLQISAEGQEAREGLWAGASKPVHIQILSLRRHILHGNAKQTLEQNCFVSGDGICESSLKGTD